jgi:dipeptidyl aminopeptidase/acylaminoacyl peptidase
MWSLILAVAFAAVPTQEPAPGLVAQERSTVPLIEGAGGYRRPPEAVAKLVSAAPTPRVVFSPDGDWMLEVERPAQPSIEFVNRRMLGLAGLRIDPRSNAEFVTSYDNGLVIARLDGSVHRRVPTGDDVHIIDIGFSQDSTWIRAVTLGDGACRLWVGVAAQENSAKRITDRLSTVFQMPVWMPDERSLLCTLVPDGRGAEPPAPLRPAGPNVRETTGERTPLRTYQDLLSSAHDAALFEHYGKSQLAIVSADDGTHKKIGRPAMIVSATPSPDGTRILVERLERPYSLSQPWWRFAKKIEVWTLDGRLERELADLPLASEIPIGGVRTGARMARWKPGEGSTVMWCEALDGGDPEQEAAHRDKWMTLDRAEGGGPRELFRVEHRAYGLTFMTDVQKVVTSEYDRDRRWTREICHDLSGAGIGPVVLEDRSSRDRYADPGNIVLGRDESGAQVAVQDGEWIYRSGQGATPEGLLPFLARQSVTTGRSEILWRCQPGVYERVAHLSTQGLTGVGGEDVRPRFLTRRESPTEVPNYVLHDGEGGRRAVTTFSDPQPGLRGVKKELLTYERADGVPLSGTLYLPPGHEPGDVHPLIVWAYPLEYNDVATAGQVSASPWRFTTVSGLSHLTMLMAGYAVLDAATMPIVGDPETMNDTFVEQIVASAEAAIAAVVERGVADADRVAVGGHSYGAFMTANLLAHSDLFRAGIARSGAYNRTLTPFGFQSERRTLWEAPEIYFAVSPFLHAAQIDEPLLLIHGEADANSGTYPMQSKRLYSALQGNGGIAKLIMLPGEAHGYRAAESVLHVQAETLDWLNRHLAPREAAEDAEGQ